jgi:hypothetical protein
MDLLRNCEVNATQVNFTDYKSRIFDSDTTVYTQFRLYHSPDGLNWELLTDLTNEKRDRPNAYIELEKPVQGATGYNVLWGIRPDRLYQTYQRFSDQEIPLEIRALNKGQDYYFAIEAFNESGVSVVSKPVHIE